MFNLSTFSEHEGISASTATNTISGRALKMCKYAPNSGDCFLHHYSTLHLCSLGFRTQIGPNRLARMRGSKCTPAPLKLDCFLIVFELVFIAFEKQNTIGMANSYFLLYFPKESVNRKST